MERRLPRTARSIMDIGCGMAGIDVLLSRHYDHVPTFVLYDKSAVDNTRSKVGFQLAKNFAAYHSHELAMSLLAANDVPLKNFACIDASVEHIPRNFPFDVVISLLSWGFHYPIDTYTPNAKLVIADIRKGTNGRALLEEQQQRESQVIATGVKWERVAC
jgi:hypothetical protein